MKNLVEVFTVSQVAERFENRTKSSFSMGDSSLETGREEFYGCGRREALKLWRSGWLDGLGMIKDAAPVQCAVNETVEALKMDVAGAYPVAALFAAGDIECMVDVSTEDDTPPIWVVANVGGAAKIKSSQKSKYGAAMLSVIEALEAGGHKVGVVAVGSTDFGDKVHLDQCIIVKRPDEYVDKTQIAFMMVHAAMQRRVMFSLRETSEALRDWLKANDKRVDNWVMNNSYGQTTAVSKDALAVLSQQLQGQTIVLPHLHAKSHTTEQWLKTMTESVQQQLGAAS